MIKAKRYIDSTLKFLYRNKVINLPKVWFKFFRDLKQLKKTQHDNEFIISPDYPCLADNTNTSGEFGRYVYQDSWAFKHVLSKKPKKLVDIASSTYFVAFAAQITGSVRFSVIIFMFFFFLGAILLTRVPKIDRNKLA